MLALPRSVGVRGGRARAALAAVRLAVQTQTRWCVDQAEMALRRL